MPVRPVSVSISTRQVLKESLRPKSLTWARSAGMRAWSHDARTAVIFTAVLLDALAPDLLEDGQGNAQEGLDDVRIEMRAGASLDLRDGRVELDRLRVRTIERHRVERVHDAEDPRVERDVLAREA